MNNVFDIIGLFTSNISFSTIVLIIGVLITSSMGFVLGWFAIRYATSRVLSAILTGRLTLAPSYKMNKQNYNKVPSSTLYGPDGSISHDGGISWSEGKY